MAVYNLARGGVAPEFGKACNTCGVDGDTQLPIFLQSDQRADGAYGNREKIEWKRLMEILDVRYGKSASDLAVGDKLYIFLQPNHADLKSIFIDFREPAPGFKFEIESVNGAEYATGKTKQTTYTENLAVEAVSDVELANLDTGAIEPRTQITHFVEDGYNAKVDAIVLKITALPKGGIPKDVKMLFARRFEQEGYMM